MEAATTAPIGRLVPYEPPLPVDGVQLIRGDVLDRYRSAVTNGELDEALTIGLRDIVRLSDAELAALRDAALDADGRSHAHMDARAIHLREQGHVAHLTAPDVVAAEIAAFL